MENMTWPERILWSRIRHGQIGYSFQKQTAVIGFIPDFWCLAARVAVEVDGGVHDLRAMQKRDYAKDSAYERAGIDCLRFSNREIFGGLGAVLIRIWSHCFASAPKDLKPYSWANSNSRHEETSEIKELRSFIAAKGLETRSNHFSNRYWNKRRISVKKA